MARDNRVLGRFNLSGIRTAPRGVPQIEVTFDIDANGILNVSAKDKDTGQEQKITISGSTNLEKADIERMVREAESHASEDKQRKELIEERNQADALAYQVERAIGEMGDGVPVNEKAHCEQLISEIRKAIKDEAPIEKIRQLKNDLQQAAYNIQQAAADRARAAQQEPHAGAGVGAGGGPSRHGSSGQNDDDVIDADYTEA